MKWNKCKLISAMFRARWNSCDDGATRGPYRSSFTETNDGNLNIGIPRNIILIKLGDNTSTMLGKQTPKWCSRSAVLWLRVSVNRPCVWLKNLEKQTNDLNRNWSVVIDSNANRSIILQFKPIFMLIYIILFNGANSKPWFMFLHHKCQLWLFSVIASRTFTW